MKVIRGWRVKVDDSHAGRTYFGFDVDDHASLRGEPSVAAQALDVTVALHWCQRAVMPYCQDTICAEKSS